MDMLKNFAITLVTTIIFMTAVELIGPDNSMKKYLKFILGLILVSVILTPIITIISTGESKITEEISGYQKMVTTKVDKQEKTTSENTMREDSFKNNFNKNCVSLLKKEYKDTDFTCELDCEVDFDTMTFKVTELNVIVGDNSIKKVKEVNIGTSEQKDKKEDIDDKQKEITEFLANELDIDEEKINVEYAK